MKLKQFKSNDNRTTNVSLVFTGYNYKSTNVIRLQIDDRHCVSCDAAAIAIQKSGTVVFLCYTFQSQFTELCGPSQSVRHVRRATNKSVC